MLFPIIAGIFITIYGAINYYIGYLGWQTLGSRLPFLSSGVYWGLFAVIVLSYIIASAGKKLLPGFLRSGLSIVGSYWIAAMAYLSFLIIIIELIRLLDALTGFLPDAWREDPASAFIIALLTLILVAGLLVYGTFKARRIRVSSYNITIPKQAGSLKQLRIAMISDLHLGGIEDSRQKGIVDAVNRLEPDIVLIAGDIVDNLTPFVKRGMVKAFRRIKSRYGVYASLGNHDYMGGDLHHVISLLKEAGIHVLRDDFVKVEESFYLVGREDKSHERMSRKKRKEPASLMERVHRELPVILLDHEPVDLDKAEAAGVDLQLSGHTHQGQFFPFNHVTRRVYKVHHGYLKTGNLQVIVSSGVSTWGPPVRIGTSSEVADIHVEFL